MIRLFLPGDGPSWLRGFAESVADAFRAIMPAPFRLWGVATADLPAAADHKHGLAFDLSRGTFLLSDGTDWLEYARLSGAAFGGAVTAPSLTVGGTVTAGDAAHFGDDHLFHGTITILTDAGESLRVGRSDGSSGELSFGAGLASISASQESLATALTLDCEEQRFACNLTTCLTLTNERATLSVPLRLHQRSTFTLPTPSSDLRGAMLYVTNESGGEVPAFCDGSNWRRVNDRAVVS